MNRKAAVVIALMLVLGVFLLSGCETSGNDSYDYRGSSAPVGNGCGIAMPGESTGAGLLEQESSQGAF